jgi:hypothetical protein
MQHLSALNPNKTALAAQLREEDIGAVHLHDLADLVQPVKQDVVDLARIDHNVLHIYFDTHHQLSKLLLSPCNLLRSFASDINLILASTVRARRGVAENAWEGWGEVDGGASRGFDELNILAGAATDQGVHGQLQLDGINMAFELCFR